MVDGRAQGLILLSIATIVTVIYHPFILCPLSNPTVGQLPTQNPQPFLEASIETHGDVWYRLCRKSVLHLN